MFLCSSRIDAVCSPRNPTSWGSAAGASGYSGFGASLKGPRYFRDDAKKLSRYQVASVIKRGGLAWTNAWVSGFSTVEALMAAWIRLKGHLALAESVELSIADHEAMNVVVHATL